MLPKSLKHFALWRFAFLVIERRVAGEGPFARSTHLSRSHLAEGGNVSPEFVVHLGKEAIFLMLLISAPMLIAGLVVGLGISILQAVTQIHEVTLTFIPKILAVSLALMVALPWMLQKMLDFMQLLMSRIPMMAN